MARKRTSSTTEADVLCNSRRRCCICFGLNRDVRIKSGQIAHLDKDSSNDAYDNLAFLCLEHHDAYDSSTSQSKNFTKAEVKQYRDELYKSVIPIMEIQTSVPVTSAETSRQQTGSSLQEYKREERKQVIIEVLSKIGPVQNLMYLASKIRLSRDSVEEVLLRLSQENVVRIDRERATTKRTYSLVNSSENRLIDTFIGTLDEPVNEDCRFIRRKQHELDAMIRTSSKWYAVETVVATQRLSKERIQMVVSCLNKAKDGLGLEEATSVLLIGISSDTDTKDVNLLKLQKSGIIIKYIEMGCPTSG